MVRRTRRGCAPKECGDASEVISVTYLGTSGIVVEHGNHALLTATFFSNPRLAGRANGFQWLQGGPRIAPDTPIIERLLPRSADRALAILVGHGHYDHLLDVPYIATPRRVRNHMGDRRWPHVMENLACVRIPIVSDDSRDSAGDSPGTDSGSIHDALFDSSLL